MELDTLYYFKVKSKEDIGTGKGKVKMVDVVELSEKDMVKQKMPKKKKINFFFK